MPQFTPGQLLIEEALPEDMRGRPRVLDGKGLRALFQELAVKHPEQYRDVTQRLMNVGSEAMYTSGGYSFGLRHMLPARVFQQHRARLQQEIQRIAADRRLSEEEKANKIVDVTGKGTDAITKSVYEESLAENNPLALQIASGAKGKPFNLMSLRGGDFLYVDHHNRAIPIPVLRSYSEGLSPAEYWANTYGARKGVVDLKTATRDAGYFGKQLTQAAHRLIITAQDHDEREYNPASPRGLPVDVDDPDNEGALLAHPVGSYKRNTVLTPKIMSHLRELGEDRVLVRSPTVGGPPDGGVYARDVGIRERGTTSPIGDFVGIGAAQAIAEPLAQAQIGCLAEGTLVRMADWSVKTIEAIEVGDRVLGADNLGRTFPTDVVNVFNSGIRPCVKTIFTTGRRDSDHRELVSTADHKILCTVQQYNCRAESNNDKPQQLPVAKKARRLSAVLFRSFNDIGYVKEPMALLVGLILGDGCYTRSVRGVFLSCYDEQLVDDLQPLLKQMPLKLTKLHGHKGYYRFSSEKVFTNKPHVLSVKMQELELGHKYAHEKIIPRKAYNWNNASVAALLSGLFATDGSIVISRRGKLSVEFASTSKEMIRQTKELLEWRFGIRCSGICSNNTGRRRALYKISITRTDDIVRFRKHITLVGVKCSTLDSALKKPTSLTRSAINRIARNSCVYYDSLPTYDIEVACEDHLFVLANGLIVSNSKHTGGVAGAGSGVSGFQAINQLVQVPKVFPGGATHAKADGRVESIEKTPGGGHRVYVGGEPHYIGIGLEPKVKVGDIVEAGDTLSDGLTNPADVVDYKGIGDGRKAFVDTFRKTAREAGFTLHRRNIELVARGLINHVKLHDQMGPYLPDDVVPYNIIEHEYQPRPGYSVVAPNSAHGQYLEQPVLHYSIGTKVRPSVVKELQRFGVKSIITHREPPPFEPLMVRGMANLSHDPDWMAQMLGSNLSKGLLKNVHRGGVSDEQGTSYVPSLARGVDFGRWPPVKGFDPLALKGATKTVPGG